MTSMNGQYTSYTTDNGIASITLTHKERDNRLDYSFIEAILKRLQQAANDFQVRTVIIRAEGEAFCKGTDPAYLSKLQQYSLEENITDTGFLAQFYHTIQRFKKVVIAEIQGAAVNEGLGLAAACDFVFAADTATFAVEDVRYANIPAVAMYFIIRKLGEQKAREILLTGESFNAKKAQELGLVYQTTSAEALSETTRQFAEQLGQTTAPGVMEYYKKMLADLPGMPYQDALAFSAKINAHARTTSEYRQGLQALLKDEQIVW
ncbi:MAG: enoyl-CoA hydratase/isomerase family protein [Bacteroidota bacterium]